MRLSDVITEYINQTLQRTGGVFESRRSELAEQFGCVPSQISYVIATRFAPEHGFVVQSRRGGGGYIRITRVAVDTQTLMLHAVNAVGDAIDAASAAAILNNLRAAEALTGREARMIAAILGDRCLAAVPREQRAEARASILKHALLQASAEPRSAQT